MRIKKHLEKGSSSERRRCFPLLRGVLCVLLAVAVCSVVALGALASLNARASASLGAEKIRIYIDQGHNPTSYHNTGAEGNGLYEQDLTFAIGALLAERLTADGRFEVCLSRPEVSSALGTDTPSSLKARVDGARAFGADYFISLHINSYTQDDVNGIEVFTSGKDRDSYAFGSALLEGLIESTGLKNRGMKEDGELYVLKNATMPATLLEMGFISNAEDAAMLSAHPEIFADGIYKGVSAYFEAPYSIEKDILLWTLGVSGASACVVAAAYFTVKKKSGYKVDESADNVSVKE